MGMKLPPAGGDTLPNKMSNKKIKQNILKIHCLLDCLQYSQVDTTVQKSKSKKKKKWKSKNSPGKGEIQISYE